MRIGTDSMQDLGRLTKATELTDEEVVARVVAGRS
jgi:hypothetical protein